MRVCFDGDLGVQPSQQVLHFRVVSAQLDASKIGPFLKQRVENKAHGAVVTRGQDEPEVREAKPPFQILGTVFVLEEVAKLLHRQWMLKDGRLRLHARIIKVDKVGLEILFGYSQDSLDVFAVAGMHEVYAFAKRLVVIKHRPAHEIRDKPFLGLGFLSQKSFIRDGAAHVNAQSHSVFFHQCRQRLGLLYVLVFCFQAESLVKVNDHHGDAKVFEFPDGLFRVLFFVVLFLPGWISAHATAENGHAVMV